MFDGTDNAKSVACQRLRIELQTDVHILSRGRAEALSGRFRGVYCQGQVHIAILLFNRSVHQTGTALGL